MFQACDYLLFTARPRRSDELNPEDGPWAPSDDPFFCQPFAVPHAGGKPREKIFPTN